MQIAFLVSDSRSGSTLLSRELADRLDGVFVPPELSFDSLYSCPLRRLRTMSAAELEQMLYEDKQLINLPVPRDKVRDALANLTGERARPSAIIRSMTTAFAEHCGMGASVVAVLKGGRQHPYLDRIVDDFGGALRLIHLFRDPRAVINSKLRTPRPYYSYETMAWGGSLLAGLQWNMFSKAVRNSASGTVPVLDISYERLLEAPEEVLTRIAEFLGTRVKPQLARTYEIPNREKGIHELVSSGRMETQRLAGWRKELGKWDLKVIEAVTLKEMKKRGYVPLHAYSLAGRAAILVAAFPELVYKTARHYVLRILNGSRKQDRTTRATS